MQENHRADRDIQDRRHGELQSEGEGQREGSITHLTQPKSSLTKHSHVVGSSQFLFECRRKLVGKCSPILLPNLVLEAMQDL